MRQSLGSWHKAASLQMLAINRLGQAQPSCRVQPRPGKRIRDTMKRKESPARSKMQGGTMSAAAAAAVEKASGTDDDLPTRGSLKPAQGFVSLV